MTGAALANFSCGENKPTSSLRNWAGNLTYGTASVLEPKTVRRGARNRQENRTSQGLGNAPLF